MTADSTPHAQNVHPELPPETPVPASAKVDVGKVVDVTVSGVHQNQSDGKLREVEVRLIDGRTGVIDGHEFSKVPAVGDEISAALLAREDPNGRIWLSYKWAQKQLAWHALEHALESREPVTGPALKEVKGGVVVDVGVRGFVPASHLSGSPEAIVGTEVTALVIEVDVSKERAVLSIRDYEKRTRAERQRKLLSELQPGERRVGKVVKIEAFGALIDLEGVRGLVHKSELSWNPVVDVEAEVKVGDELEVVVLAVHKSKKNVSLSVRQLTPDPIADVTEGETYASTVERVVEYGAFAKLEPSGVVGLVHVSELTDLPGARADQCVVPGEQLNVKVLQIDPKRRRIALSAVQAGYAI